MPSRILIVSADDETRTTLEMAFAYHSEQFQVFSAPSSTSALLQVGVVNPDLVILHSQPPACDGQEVLHRLRRLSDVPVIAVCDAEGQDHCIAALGAGADVWMSKPLALRELQARVRALVRREQIRVRAWPAEFALGSSQDEASRVADGLSYLGSRRLGHLSSRLR